MAGDLEFSGQALYVWRRQVRVDRGLERGLTGGEEAELAAVRCRIAELETELLAACRAVELVGEVVPDGDSRRSWWWLPWASRSRWPAG